MQALELRSIKQNVLEIYKIYVFWLRWKYDFQISETFSIRFKIYKIKLLWFGVFFGLEQRKTRIKPYSGRGL